MALTAKQLKNRLEVLKNERANINSEWEDISYYVAPGRGRMYETQDDENSIDRDFPEKYDSTAVIAAQGLAASLHSGLTSPATNWFGLRFQEDELNDNVEASEWIQACQQKIFYMIQESNFNLEVNEIYLDLVSFGTTTMLHEYDPNTRKFTFRAAFPREMYFEEDFNGNIVGIYRERQYTAQQIMLEFPTKCPDNIKKQGLSAGSANTKYSILHCIRLVEDNKDADVSKLLAPKKRPFEERYILTKDGMELTEKDVGYYEMPAYITRWGKMTGSKFGFSPALTALPDIKTLNTLVSQILDAAAKVIDPAIMTTQRGVIGDIDLSPGGETVVRDLDAMKPFESGARFDVGQLTKEDLQSSIKQAFFAEQLELPQNDRMTATEVQVRYERMQQLLGPALFRIQSDFLSPLVNRSFNILYREGQLPEMPDVVKQAQGNFEVDYLGPLARSQKMGQVNALQQLVGVMERIAPIKPDVVRLVKWEDALRDAALTMSVPAKYLKSEAEIAEELKNEAQQQQNMMATQQAGELASAMQKGAAASKAGAETLAIQKG